MHQLPRLAAFAAAIALTCTACDSVTDDQTQRFISAGFVQGFLFIDSNLNNTFNLGVDQLVRGQRVGLRPRGARTDFDNVVTDSAGFFAFLVAPVGTYRVLASPNLLGDSLEVLPGSDTEFVIAGQDTVVVVFGVRLRSFNVAEARAMALGTRRWVRGTALNTQGLFGDSTVHLSDSTAAIRAINVRPNFATVSQGDSVQFLGTRTQRDGQPVIDVTAVLVRNFGNLPQPFVLTTQQATTAAGGTRDAALVVVRNAVISDTSTVAGVHRLGVNDGSGRLVVYFSPTIGFDPLSTYAPGGRFDITGLLVPVPGGGGWQLKPRARSDLVIRP